MQKHHSSLAKSLVGTWLVSLLYLQFGLYPEGSWFLLFILWVGELVRRY